MAKRSKSHRTGTTGNEGVITRITVGGFKSISTPQHIDIKPLTILAGANSSGKSSIMQPLLLLKQTLEATYDPGPLLLDGPNVRFNSAVQLFSRNSESLAKSFRIEVEIDDGRRFCTTFERDAKRGVAIQSATYTAGQEEVTLSPRMADREIRSLPTPSASQQIFNQVFLTRLKVPLAITRNRFFLEVGTAGSNNFLRLSYADWLEDSLIRLTHLPGLRGNPERTYPVAAAGPLFPGTFEKYAASVIARWQDERDESRLNALGKDLALLGLTRKVSAKRTDDTKVELQVGRLPVVARGGARDLVNIADVGFGVSQTLPVLVALHAAGPGQLVYIEQPETHLHPRAQSAMAQVLASAANRGVRVVAETHSELLILGIQTLVAEGELAGNSVALHWFSRIADGTTRITSSTLDEAGAFGAWPEDFGDVRLQAEQGYLDAAEPRSID
ncbi:MAG: AAA family ATPase [Acidobacteriota bacterium]